MEIERVSYGENGNYVVNKNLTSSDATELTIPIDPANRHYVMVQEWINNGGVITPWVDPTTPYQHWHNDISKLDKDMPRSLEDMLDGMPDKSGVAQITLDRLQSKKELRATKP